MKREKKVIKLKNRRVFFWLVGNMEEPIESLHASHLQEASELCGVHNAR